MSSLGGWGQYITRKPGLEIRDVAVDLAEPVSGPWRDDDHVSRLDVVRHASLFRGTRAGADDNMCWVQRFNLLDRNFVVAEDFRILSLEALVKMKLNSFRRKDQVHLLDLLEVGLIDQSWLPRLQPEQATRLQQLIDDPNG